MVNLNKMKGKIIEKFGTYSDYAKHIGFNKCELSKILNGKRKIDTDFAETLIRECELSAEEACSIFFSQEVSKEKQ